MKLDKTTLLIALAVCAALAAVTFLREPFEPVVVSDSVGDSLPATSVPAHSGPRLSAGALTAEEHAKLAEVQRNFAPDEMERVFNPLTFDERRQIASGPFDHLGKAAQRYDREWAAFVDGLGLSALDARFVRDAWIEARALDTELGAALADGTHEHDAILAAKDEARDQLNSRLSQVLTTEQMEAFFEHREQLITDGIASMQADVDQMIADGYHGIISAAADKDLPTVQAYLASGADPNRFTVDGNSAMLEAARDNSVEILQALIDAGGDVNLPNHGGWSALIHAARYGSLDSARVLLDAGADPNHRRDPGNPLSVALTTAARNGHTETVRVLLDAGADATGYAGENALASAIGFGDNEMQQMLIEAGADSIGIRATAARQFRELGRRLGLVND